MSDEHTIQVEGGPTLFDGLTPQEQGDAGKDTTPTYDPTEGETWAEIYRLLDETKHNADRAGIYTLIPPVALAKRAEIYYNQRVEAVVAALAASGMNPDDIKTVTADYARVTFGTYVFTAHPEIMSKAMKALPPAKAASIDLYGLYYGLLLNYARHVVTLYSYQTNVAGKGATEETKRQFVSRFYSPAEALAFVWLTYHGVIEPQHFAGFDTSELAANFGRIREFADLGEYVTYYTFSKYALLATPQELAEINPPSIHTQVSITDYAEQASAAHYADLANLTRKYTEAATSEPSPEQEQARQAAAKWDVDVIKLHPNYGVVLSRPVNIAPNGMLAQTFPIQRYIDDFKKKNPTYKGGEITEMTVQKVVGGLNLLPTYELDNMTVGPDGRLSFLTNISRFAEICGYADANQSEKLALLGALSMLDGLYFVVDKPKRVEERTNRKGRKFNVQVGGVVALRFLFVQEIGLETGHLKLDLYPESLRGRPTLITAKRYQEMRAKAKGLAQSRFNAQLLGKGHKSERDLIDEVFGFTDMIANATPDELPKVTKYVQGHRAEYRKKVLGWFQEYVEAGILTDFKREPSKTDKRDFTLSWTCPDASKLDPPPFDLDATPQEPDEQ